MGFDAIAPWYRFCEQLAFGGRLQKHRLRFLDAARSASHALVLGDGNGRFLEQLALHHPQLPVDAIDLSPVMCKLAAQRLGRHPHDVRFITADARIVPFAPDAYDLIATHFFLDCFPSAELPDLIDRVARHASPNACWIVSEFRKPNGLLRGWHAALWLKVMYFFFQIAAGLQTRTLPDYRRALACNGFVLIAEHASRTKLISSELWRRCPQNS